MGDSALTRDGILAAAEEVLRRYGPAKATVVDVARALGVSHGSVYRHFPSKAALRDAVTAEWLGRIHDPLAGIAAEAGPAPERLRRWLAALIAAKRGRAADDPELFATYLVLASEARAVVQAHREEMADQLAQIVADGVRRGEFAPQDPAAAGRALLGATARFHHPAHAPEWSDPALDADFAAVLSLLLRGLGAGEATGHAPGGAPSPSGYGPAFGIVPTGELPRAVDCL